MLLQLVLHLAGGSRKDIQIEWEKDDTIGTLKERLAKKIDHMGMGIGREQMNVIFSGKALSNGEMIENLQLGPSTCLTVTMKIANKSSEEHDDELSSSEEDDCTWVKLAAEPISLPTTRGFCRCFHVFCKQCQCLQQAKLRAYCRCCQSSAIIFKKREEPQNWQDVLDTNKMQVECQDCDEERAVNFRFKCLACNEIGVPLMHVKSTLSIPRQTSICIVCNEQPKMCAVLSLGCPHIVCVDCFRIYAGQLVDQMRLVRQHSVGYTINCPAHGCSECVTDVHTFYLLGIEGYGKYQSTAAQLYFDHQYANAVARCPAPDCGAAFLVDDDGEEGEAEGRRMFLCPECSKMFCGVCRMAGDECKCSAETGITRHDEEEEDLKLIRKTTKPCPSCRVPTERAGGCAHMYCTQCKNEWCFICQAEWTDNCQWDHWFD